MDLLWIISSVFCIHLLLLRPTSSAVSFRPKTAILFPGGNVIFTCNQTSFRFWIINETDNIVPNHDLLNINGVTSNGTMLIITQSVNNTLYGCAIALPGGDFITDTGIVYVATAPDQVPGVMVITDSITLNDDNVTLTLSWGEPFNNFDPIVNYIVSCSGDVTCPTDFTIITNNTTRSYTINNLTTMICYTFSVVASNSIGSGEAAVIMITTPSLPDNVTGVMLMCEVLNQINQCIVEWESIAVDSDLEQPLIYEVSYNGTMQNVTSPTATLTFTAPSLPDGVFNGNITVTVTAINRLGRGTPSDPEYSVIMSSSVSDAQVTTIIPEDATNSTYSITVNCTINPDSTADMCEVTATANGQIILTGTALVMNMMATVTIDGLACGVTYTIIAGGTFDGLLVGPRSSHGTTTGHCPPIIITTIAIITSMISQATPPMISPTASLSQPPTGASTGAIVGGVIGGVCALVLLALIIIPLWWCCCIRNRQKSSGTSNTQVAMNNIPFYDSIQDYEATDAVKMEPNPAYQGLPPDHVKMETNPAYQVLTSDQANKGPDPAYQDMSSFSGRAIVSEQKPAGDVNYYKDIINDQNINMTENPSYAVP